MRQAKQHIADDDFETWKKAKCEILQRDLQ
jgi:queuine tRNA-ribosyltransferase